MNPAPPTATVPLPFCSPLVTLLVLDPLAATSVGALALDVDGGVHRDQVLGRELGRDRVQRRQERRVRLGGAALTGGTTLSAFCRCLSSSQDDELGRRRPGAHEAARPRCRLRCCCRRVPDEPELAAGRGQGDRQRARGCDEPGTRAHECPPSVSRAAGGPRRVSGGRISRTGHATPSRCARGKRWRPVVRFVIAQLEPVRAGRRRGGLPRRAVAAGAAGRATAPRGPGVTRPGSTHEQDASVSSASAGDQDGAGDDQPVVLLAEAEVDRCTPRPPPPTSAASAGGRHHLHGRRPEAGHAPAAGPAAARPARSPGARLMPIARAASCTSASTLAEPDEGVGQDRRDGEDGEGDRRRACRRSRSGVTAKSVSSASVGIGPADVGQHDDAPPPRPAGAQERRRAGSATRERRARTAIAEIARCSPQQVEDAARSGSS